MPKQATTEEKGVEAWLVDGDDEDGRRPQNVKCWECSHVWVGLYLPQPISVAAKMMKNLTCPKCGTGSSRIGMTS